MQDLVKAISELGWQATLDRVLAEPDVQLRAHALATMARTAIDRHGFEEAIVVLEQARHILPDESGLYVLLAISHSRLGRWSVAQDHMARALALNPQEATYHYNFGRILQAIGANEQALQAYSDALSLQPNMGLALLNRGNIHLQAGRWDRAAEDLHLASAGGVDEDLVLGSLIVLDLQQGIWDRWQEWHDRVRALLSRTSIRLEPFATLSLNLNAQEQNELARRYVQARVRNGQRFRRDAPRREGRIRLLYVSSDFGRHAVTLLTAGLYANHDRTKFEVMLMSLKCLEDDYRERLTANVEHFVDADTGDDAAVLHTVRSFDPDIAVDLNGHTIGGRPELFELGLAPVQLHYLGFPAGSGSTAYDYILADPVVIPAEHASYYSEKIVHLPHGFQISDDQREQAEPMSRADLGWPEQAFLFASFNGIHKINPTVFACWLQILAACPDACFILVDEGETVAMRLRQRMQEAGIDATRLKFVPRTSYAAYLGRLSCVDLVLDTFPFNGGTSTSDALWAGVPVLTRTGETYAARMSTSLLHHAGLHDLITPNDAEYVSRAVWFYKNPQGLNRIRDRLRDQSAHHVRFATEPKVRAIELAYEQMVLLDHQGLEPQSFALIDTTIPEVS